MLTLPILHMGATQAPKLRPRKFRPNGCGKMKKCEARIVFAVLTSTIFLNATHCSFAQQQPPATVWGKLGIPQGVRALRDGLVNRRGNFPGLERKPPVKPIADPSNLEEGKPEMLKAAAEIKQAQDLKKQKIKAIKFLGDVNCGCYNKDGKVEKAFLEALEDCDPDVKKAAIESLDGIVGKDPRCQLRASKQKCSKCSDRCAITCCTEDIRAKLWDLATGLDETGCYKEPDPEIRKAAKALFCKCPVPPAKPIVPEELIPPDPEKLPEAPKPLKDMPPIDLEKQEADQGGEVAVNMSDIRYGQYTDSPVIVDHVRSTLQKRRSPYVQVSHANSASSAISNPEQLLTSKVVAYKKHLGELLIQMPNSFVLGKGWKVVLVDAKGNHARAQIVDLGGRRVLLTLDGASELELDEGNKVSVGLVAKN